MVVDGNGTAYAITHVGPERGADVSDGRLDGSRVGVIEERDQRQHRNGSHSRPGPFVTISGSNLASHCDGDTLPPPTVLGGSCVLMDGVAIPLLSTSPTQIQAQIPASIRSGSNVFQVRSLDNAQRSAPVVITVQAAGQ